MDSSRIPPRYRVIQEVGQGGMAVVYRAQDETLKREVAIKILHMHLSGEPESKARLEREAQAVAKLRHANILEIFDYSGRDSVSPFIVTEFIDGETLKQFLGRHPLSFPETAALIAAEIAGALAHAHALGIIHRDVKPENVMIRRDGLLKLTDFGIAQLVDLQRMTVTGQLLGSPAYMAPELIDGRPLDFRTDVFSVGVLLYQLATGELPFSGKNPHEVLKRISSGRFTDPRTLCRLVGDGLQRIIARALAREPDARYPVMADLAEDLAEYAADAGLREVRGEIKAFFTDPEGYERSLPGRMGIGLLACARAAVEGGRTLKALELLNRLLALHPRHPDGLKLLGRLQARRRMRTAGLVTAGAAAMGLVAFGVSRMIPSTLGSAAASASLGSAGTASPESAGVPPTAELVGRRPVAAPLPVRPPTVNPPAPALAASVAPTPSRATAPRQVVQRHALPARRMASERSTSLAAHVAAGSPAPVVSPPAVSSPATPGAVTAPAPVSEPAPRTFVLGPTPQNVDVYLDGRRVFAYGPEHKTLTVPWTGNHVIELRSPSGCCFVERIDVGPDHALPPENVIARRLAWRPARLVITSDPPAENARVLVGDPRGGASSVARLGDDVDIKLGPLDEGKKEVEVVVDTGDRFLLATDRVLVRAGKTTMYVVKLKAAR